MPELPEVETIVRSLTSCLIGKRISSVEIRKPLVVKMKPGLFTAGLLNKSISKIHRHGKAIFIALNDSPVNLRVHLGMTGQMLFKPLSDAGTKHTRVVFQFSGADFICHYTDMRQFGRLELVKGLREKNWGPDAWDSSNQELFDAFRQKSGMIKHALLNQNVIAGVGNIYADESLFRAKIHPKKKLERLSDAKLKELCVFIKDVLRESLDLGGTSFRNYVNTAGSRGGFKGRLNVYGKQGTPCPVCKTKIRRIVVASRGTHFCPNCQKR